MNNAVNLILNSSLGAELSHEEAGELSALMSMQELKDGDFLITESTRDDSLHVLLEGKLEVVKKTAADGFGQPRHSQRRRPRRRTQLSWTARCTR